MNREIIYICTEDRMYGERLLQFLSEKANTNVEFGLLTRREIWENMDSCQNVAGLLVEDNEQQKGKGPPVFSGKIVPLKEKKEKGKISYIFKYQNAESIYEEILEKFQISDVCPQKSSKEEAEVILVFTPERGNKGIFYSLSEGTARAKESKTIFISLSALPVLFSVDFTEEISYEKNLSELLLALEDENFEERVKELIFTIGELDILPPVCHFKDLLDTKAEDLISLITRLQKECGYQICYVECSEFYEFTLPLLSFADHIVMPKGKNFLDQIRLRVLMQYLQMEKMEHLEEKMTWTDIDEPMEITKENILSDLLDNF